MTARLSLEQCLKIWRGADAVCFDVDSTVITTEGLDDLAKFCGNGEEVAKWYAYCIIFAFSSNQKEGVLFSRDWLVSYFPISRNGLLNVC